MQLLHSGHLSGFSFQQKYRAEFEKNKGKMIGLKGLQDDINIAHSVYANKLQSDVNPSPRQKNSHIMLIIIRIIRMKYKNEF